MPRLGALTDDDTGDDIRDRINSLNMELRNLDRDIRNMKSVDPFYMSSLFDNGSTDVANGNGRRNKTNDPFGNDFIAFPKIPNLGRLFTDDLKNMKGTTYCASSTYSMTSGPDGRKQVVKAAATTTTGPGGIAETKRLFEDSVKGVKKIAVGHQIGDRAHIVAKEKNLRSGEEQERQELFNLNEDEADSFDREFTKKAKSLFQQKKWNQLSELHDQFGRHHQLTDK